VGSTVRIRARDRWLVALAGLGFVVVCLAANATRRPAVAQRLDVSPGAPTTPTVDPRPVNDQLEPVRSHHWHLGVPWWLLEKLLILLIGVGVLLLILLIIRLVPQLNFRRARRPADEPVEYAAPGGREQVAGQVSDTLDYTLAAFRHGDRQRAIIACWIRLEQIAEAAGFARQSSETSSELADRWLARLPLSRQPLLTLAALYREARYSSHRLPDSALDTARGALEQLRREIAAPAGRGPA
jgi:hypothetical protein